jgi:hypothetical protein
VRAYEELNRILGPICHKHGDKRLNNGIRLGELWDFCEARHKEIKVSKSRGR